MRILLTASLLLPSTILGAGFQLQERSARGLGRAFSGEAAIADDASVLASNPAAILLVPGDTAISVGVSLVSAKIDVSGTYTPPASPAVPAIGRDVGNDSAVPYLYLTRRLNENLSVGFGSFTTFGLITNYPTGFSARTLADHSELKTVNLNPSIAWRFHPQWSVGAGFNALHAEGKLTATLPSTLPTLDLAGDDWGYGFNVGLLFELNDTTRFGLHYRSEVDLTLSGRAVSVVPFFNGPGTVDLTLPDSFELSAYHEFNDRWAIHGDVVWTGWSDFDQLRPVVTGSPVQPPVTQENWTDAWRLSLGTTWKATERLTIRGGIAYDESPVEDHYRTLRIPDSDRIWLSLGISYRFHPCWTLDVAYTHLFIDSIRINETTASGTFSGVAGGDADLFALGLSGSF
ncbi:long-chain fatty acid transporter [Haloferula helveola]|uniref:Long-chain fatty acid transporter n=1 Tax=Haloferula helveola TaxID=490095 RepID=A0ABM7RM34_9BACT|nr:long-chain fatty acid transporter [Haloferula helveola]